jgi:iron transport multicopper oxidase
MNATETDCDTPCAGDPTELCGSNLRLNLYWNSGATPNPPPTMVKSSSDGLWDLLGCYKYANIPLLRFSGTAL